MSIGRFLEQEEKVLYFAVCAIYKVVDEALPLRDPCLSFWHPAPLILEDLFFTVELKVTCSLSLPCRETCAGCGVGSTVIYVGVDLINRPGALLYHSGLC